ncbi:MAG: prohibitin family protein [Bacteroidetes bacterium]|nr:prohibitin family protein [Bacteroidota bacterium]
MENRQANQSAIARLAILFGIIVVIGIFFAGSMFKTIKAGELGVIYRPFAGGLDKDKIFNQGFHVIAPWNDLIVYDVKEQIREEQLNVLSSNGLNITLEVSCRYNPIKTKIGYLHDEVGVNYESVIVKDMIRTTVRKVVGRYTPEQLYASKREEIERETATILEEMLKGRYVSLGNFALRDIKLPDDIKSAIEDKLAQQQEAEKYKYKIEREAKEKERKMIEAEGIKEFQRIVSEGISDKLLKWKGIEATQDLAKSPNSKVIVIGSGKDGLPIILGGEK